MKRYNWVAQSAHGAIVLSVSKPKVVNQIGSWVYDTNEFVIIGIERSNPNWNESLIDLSKNDYIIKDGILMATRKHAALIHAWADGAVIQGRSGNVWENCDNPTWFDDEEYRIKPATRTVKFRNWYSSDGKVYGTYSSCECNNPNFVTWIDKDWREVEIEL